MDMGLSFGECEHEGDMNTYIDDLHKSGASVLEYEIDEDEEEGTVQIVIDDLSEFLAKFRKTESFGFCNLA